MNNKKVVKVSCIERIPTHLKYTKGTAGAIFQKSTIWRSNSKGTITITFGTQTCTGCSPDASWSFIGTQTLDNSPAMNLGFIDPPFADFTFNNKKYSYDTFKYATRNYCGYTKSSCDKNWEPGATIIHEFCHSLGMLHEHQNNILNSNNVKLNTQAVIDYYVKLGLGEEAAKVNVIDRYSCTGANCDYEGSKFDVDSIMLYALEDDWVIGPNPTKPNFKLSQLDKEWLTKEYPLDNKNMPELTYKFTDVSTVDKSKLEWKEAWTQKTIIEKLLPIVGIKIRFINSDGSMVTVAPIQNPTYPITTMPVTMAMTTEPITFSPTATVYATALPTIYATMIPTNPVISTTDIPVISSPMVVNPKKKYLCNKTCTNSCDKIAGNDKYNCTKTCNSDCKLMKGKAKGDIDVNDHAQGSVDSNENGIVDAVEKKMSIENFTNMKNNDNLRIVLIMLFIISIYIILWYVNKKMKFIKL